MVVEQTHTEQIMTAVASLIQRDGKQTFSRKDVRDEIGVDPRYWNDSYGPTFQGMRIDQPGGAPFVASRFRNVLKRVGYGLYELTEYGASLLTEFMASSTTDGKLDVPRGAQTTHTKLLPSETPVRLSVDQLERMRNRLILPLRRLDVSPAEGEPLGAIIGRLTANDRIPRRIAPMMRAIIEARNDAVYRGILPTPIESRALLAIWDATTEWFQSKGIILERTS